MERGRNRILVTSSLRVGSVRPRISFSTGSTDIEVGLVFVDPIGVGEGEKALRPLRSISYWVMGGGDYPIRVNDTLEEADLYPVLRRLGVGSSRLSRAGSNRSGGRVFSCHGGGARNLFSRVRSGSRTCQRISLNVRWKEGPGGPSRQRLRGITSP